MGDCMWVSEFVSECVWALVTIVQKPIGGQVDPDFVIQVDELRLAGDGGNIVSQGQAVDAVLKDVQLIGHLVAGQGSGETSWAPARFFLTLRRGPSGSIRPHP